ncbi:DUF4132 domain-containing protein [Actinomadura formosensis]|uniref:DUF4132 domain-containing protein n=1 Tax=Actinomadura formosensis TaxID=60706 RepID=UPI003D8ADAE1
MRYDTLAAEARKDDGLDDVRFAALGRSQWLLDLLRRRHVESQGDGTLWKDDRELEAHLRRRQEIEDEIHRRLTACAGADAGAAVLSVALVADLDDVGFWELLRRVRSLVPVAGPWTPGQVAVLLQRACEFPRNGYWFAEMLDTALTVADRLDPGGRRELLPWLRHVDGRFARADVPIGYRRPVTRRLSALLENLDEDYIPEGLLPVCEAWAAPLRDLTAASPTAGLSRFVRHLVSLSAPRPSQKWRRTCVSLADEASARDAVAACLRALAGDDPLCSAERGAHADWISDEHSHHYHYLVHQNHGDIARGIVWAAALTGGPGTAARLGALALRAGTPGGDVHEDLKLAGAAINALAAVDDPGALESLWRLQGKTKNRALRKQIDTALRTAAERRGITPAQLAERSVPAHGLRPDGSVERTLGAHTVRVAIEDAASVRLTCTGADGRASRTVPAAVKEGFPDELKELKALAKEVRGVLSSERARIEGLMSDDRVWPYGEWCEHYRDHPITGALVRGLIWEFQDQDGGWHAALADSGGGPVQVRLWHPIRATTGEVRAWRERIAGERIRQPFKQAFREIYLLTPAEKETGTYSNRFAAHIVRYRRLYALFKERGWRANFLSGHGGGREGEACGEFGGGRWRACFFHDPVSEAGWGTPEYATTDQVRFERGHGRRRRETPLADVPPVVFSEAMRDVDLFVAVTSIAADPRWSDRGADRYAAYWRAATFGELTANAEVRRAALERILPRTKIAGRCSIDGRYLVVRGELRTYKIHLGSANILMEPDDSYLCVVRAGGGGGGSVHLPFEDERLSLILSKAFLLAADHRITDAAILTQIRRPVT